MEEYQAKLQDEGKVYTTINRAIAAIRWWARRLVDIAYDIPLPEDPKERETWKEQREEIGLQSNRVAAIQDVKGELEPAGRSIGEGEFRELISTCVQEQSAAGARDRAMFALAWVAGMRRSELIGLMMKDVTFDQGDNGPAYTLLIKGKGNRERTNHLFGGAALCLADWLDIRGNDPGLIFCRIRKGDRLLPKKGLSGEALRLILLKRIGQTGTPALTWHDFRRTLIGSKLNLGYDLVTIGKIIGHKSIDTTAKYDRRSEETLKAALKDTFVPYQQMGVKNS